MESDAIAELRTLYIFTPPDGQTWNLTYTALEAVLRRRDPDTFIRIDEGGPVTATSMDFGITLDDELLEAMALLQPEGVTVKDATARTAATFALWLRNHVIPAGAAMVFNTEWGVEDDLPDTPVPDATRPRVAAAFMDHLVEAGDLD
ncbi:hypothetical protein OG599_34895 (plasmid) [Streptomyces sp. NBC_01335]|uniref:hypothetical protein n=1 Tax=Streptomyces sp. NBC_01335 TaxID=2903828 RepID=UPI002E0DEDA7|nr:hypothetical protein OG599_34895 [Streptomyces sp. NBC_01335]